MKKILIAGALAIVLAGGSLFAQGGPAPAQIQAALRSFLATIHTWTATQTFTNVVINGTCTGCSATVPGSNTQVLFNDSGAIGADAGMTYVKATDTLSLGVLVLTTKLAVAQGGTNCAAASITCFNNITGFTASGTSGDTSTNLVFSSGPTFSGTLAAATITASSTIGASSLVTATRSSVSDNVQIGFRSAHLDTGTAGVGSGSGYEFSMSNSAGNNQVVGGDIRMLWTTATAGSEVSDFVVQLKTAGVQAEKFRVSGGGVLSAAGYTQAGGVLFTDGSGIIGQDSDMSFVTDTLTITKVAATTLNGNTFTTGTYTLTGAASKTLTFSNSLTLAGTDSTTLTFPTTSATIARTDAGQTFTGTNIFGIISLGATPAGTGALRLTNNEFVYTKNSAAADVQLIGLDSSNFTLLGGSGSNAVKLNGQALVWGTDNAQDIGASAATRPRTGYFGTSLVAPIGTFATSVAIGGATIGSNALAVTGTATFSSTLSVTGNITLGSAGFLETNSGAIGITQGALKFGSGAVQSWGSTASYGSSIDTTFSRNAAGVVQFGTTAANALGSLMATNGTYTGIVSSAAFTFNGTTGKTVTACTVFTVGGCTTGTEPTDYALNYLTPWFKDAGLDLFGMQRRIDQLELKLAAYERWTR